MCEHKMEYFVSFDQDENPIAMKACTCSDAIACKNTECDACFINSEYKKTGEKVNKFQTQIQRWLSRVKKLTVSFIKQIN